MTDNELATAEPTPMSILAKMADTADPAKIGAMMELQHKWEDRQALRDYSEALAMFQGSCPPIKKTRGVCLERDSDKPSYYFASLDDIMREIRPHLQEAGLSVSFTCDAVEGKLVTTCFIQHGIHKEPHMVTLPIPSSMRVNDTQKWGAALSYGKRYALMAALNIVVEDEDTDARGMDMKPVKLITEEQAITITEWCVALHADMPVFHKHFGVAQIADIRADQFDDVVSTLKRKEQELEQKKNGSHHNV